MQGTFEGIEVLFNFLQPHYDDVKFYTFEYNSKLFFCMTSELLSILHRFLRLAWLFGNDTRFTHFFVVLSFLYLASCF